MNKLGTVSYWCDGTLYVGELTGEHGESVLFEEDGVLYMFNSPKEWVLHLQPGTAEEQWLQELLLELQ